MKWLVDQAYVLMVITSISWSGNSIIGRAVHETIPPVGLAFWRWALALPVFLFFAWPHLRYEWREALRHWGILLFLAVLSVTVYNTFIYQGLTLTTAINAFLINTSRPVIIVFLSFILFRERISALQALGFILALFGAFVIVVRGDPAVLRELSFNQGDLWIVAATICWALYTVYLPKRPKLHPTTFMAVSVAAGMALLLPVYLWEAFTVKAVPVSAETLWSVGYLALISTVVAYLCYNRVVELIGANKAGLTSYVMPVLGVLLAVIFLDEQFRIFHTVGVVFILGGVVFATRSKRTA